MDLLCTVFLQGVDDHNPPQLPILGNNCSTRQYLSPYNSFLFPVLTFIYTSSARRFVALPLTFLICQIIACEGQILQASHLIIFRRKFICLYLAIKKFFQENSVSCQFFIHYNIAFVSSERFESEFFGKQIGKQQTAWHDARFKHLCSRSLLTKGELLSNFVVRWCAPIIPTFKIRLRHNIQIWKVKTTFAEVLRRQKYPSISKIIFFCLFLMFYYFYSYLQIFD